MLFWNIDVNMLKKAKNDESGYFLLVKISCWWGDSRLGRDETEDSSLSFCLVYLFFIFISFFPNFKDLSIY